MERIGDDLARELQRLGPQAGVGELARAWPQAVGDAIARNAWPARIARDGTLHVATTSSAWAFELAQLAPTLLARLRESLGDVAPAAVRFAPGPVPEPAAPPPGERPERPPAPSPEELEAAARLAAAIADDELRAAAARAAAAGFVARRTSSAGRTTDRPF